MKALQKKLNKLAQLPPEEKKAFLKAAWNMLHITLTLNFLKFNTFKNYYRKISSNSKTTFSEKTYTQAIKRFASLRPQTFSCLPQALCFKKEFQDSKLIIGVQTGNSSKLDAHAWVERKGEFLIGEIPNFEYIPLWIWE